MKKLTIFTLCLMMSLMGFAQLKLTPGTKLKVDSATNLKLKNGLQSDSATITNKGIIDLYGNLINYGEPLFNSNSDSGEFWFSGGTQQQISGNTPVGFRGHVRIKNPSSVALTNLSSGTDQAIYGVLSMDTGKIKLNNYNLFVDSITADGYDDVSYVETTWTGELRRVVPADGTTKVVFPVGRNGFAPVILQNSATATTDTYGVIALGEEPADNNTEGFVDLSWVVTEETTGGSDLNVTPQWNETAELTGFDRTNSTVGRTTDYGATYEWGPSGPATGSDPYTQTGDGFTSVGTFAVGSGFTTVENITIIDGQTECFDATNTLTVAGSGTTVDILSGGNATFVAGKRIHWKPGFHAHEGSYGHGYITTTGEYCNQQQPRVAVQTPSEEEAVDTPEFFVDEDEDVKIYPNPTLGKFTIDFMGKTTTADIILMNSHGNQVIETRCVEQNKKEINISHMPGGMYVIVIVMKTETQIQIIKRKIIKNK